MWKYLAVGVLFFGSAAFACPDSVSVSVHVGDLHIDDRTDSDFLPFANTNFQVHLKAQPTLEGCLFISDATPELAVELETKIFLVVTSTARGEKVQLDGYTAKNKLYEIRSLSGDVSGNEFAAGFYDASGPAKELLGQAVLAISE